MRIILWKEFIATACLALTVNPAASAEAASDNTAILQLEQGWVNATLAGDRVFQERLLHPDATIIAENGEVIPRATVINTPARKGASQTLEDLQVHVHGDTAIVIGISRYRESATIAPVNLRFLTVLLRGGPEGWQVMSSQVTPIRR